MNRKQYETIKLQINSEKEKILTEISALLRERYAVETQKQKEIDIFLSRGKMFQPGQSVAAGAVSLYTFSPEKMKELDKKISLIGGFIRKNELMLEQVKEKERTIDDLFRDVLKQQEKEREKKEETTLLDLKMGISSRGS
ncbi:MAG: cytoplasmic protein [Ectobacillus sp.]